MNLSQQGDNRKNKQNKYPINLNNLEIIQCKKKKVPCLDST